MKRKYSWYWMVVIGLLVLIPPAAAKGKKKIKQVVIKEVTRVEGKIQKPEVWYLLPRSNLNFEGFKLEKKLVPKIEQTAKKEPF